MIGILQRAPIADPALTPVNEMVQLMHDRWGPLPSRIWRDPYVLAYMQIIIAGLLKSGVVVDAGDEDHHLAVARVCVPWTERGDEAQKGAEDAAFWLAFYMRRPNLANQHVRTILEVVQGREHDGLVAFGEPGCSMGAAAGMLFCSSILRRVGELAQAAAA